MGNYSQMEQMPILGQIRRLFQNRLYSLSRQWHQLKHLFQQQHRYQYRISRALWLMADVLAIPLLIQGQKFLTEWKKFRRLIQ